MQFHIQHQSYNLAELKNQCILQLKNIDLPEWEREIWMFIDLFIDEEQAEFVNKTSGSTGIPKEIHIQKKQAIASAQKTNRFFNLKKNDRVHLLMHAKYIGAKMMIVRALIGEMHLTYSEPKMNALCNIQEDIDFCACVPIQLVELLEHYSNGNKYIKNLIIGGGALNENSKSLLWNHATQYFQTFGMTETISHIALLNITKNEKAYTLLPNIAISKDDRDCLIIDAPDIGVHQLVTNDIVDIIHKNQFLWKGRFDHIINSGGIKIHPEQIETKLDALIHNPFFITCIADDKLGDKIILIIQSSSNIHTDELLNSIKSVLEKYEVPKNIFVLDQFIYTETNKINRKETRALVQNH